jgi:hypothetical protein
MNINNGGILKTKLYDKGDDFTFPIVNFPFMCWNIQASPAYGIYSRDCVQWVVERAQLLTQKLLKHSYVAPRLKSSLQKFYDRHHNLVDRDELSISKMTMNIFLFT